MEADGSVRAKISIIAGNGDMRLIHPQGKAQFVALTAPGSASGAVLVEKGGEACLRAGTGGPEIELRGPDYKLVWRQPPGN